MQLGFIDPKTGQLERASSVQLALMARTDPDEARRKAAFEGLASIERDPANPVSIATLPIPEEADYLAKGGQFGPHNLHENRPNSYRSERVVFATYFNAGLRAIFLSIGYLGWFVNAYVFMSMTVFVFFVLIRRAVSSSYAGRHASATAAS